jgi:hypothetical protein
VHGQGLTRCVVALQAVTHSFQLAGDMSLLSLSHHHLCCWIHRHLQLADVRSLLLAWAAYTRPRTLARPESFQCTLRRHEHGGPPHAHAGLLGLAGRGAEDTGLHARCGFRVQPFPQPLFDSTLWPSRLHTSFQCCRSPGGMQLRCGAVYPMPEARPRLLSFVRHA